MVMVHALASIVYCFKSYGQRMYI